MDVPSEGESTLELQSNMHCFCTSHEGSMSAHAMMKAACQPKCQAQRNNGRRTSPAA